ncbi:hypothetical protein HKBW3S44_01056 [Candidatus Hakubella thermalkaliphila]|uniref:Uncharacterized protein n=1 Tax=Candidatus Hakubella thermalkaliphila TaxID=2754717 RepID=A0A6V8PBZ2_9ACTN|nr:hypothetical protein [Candidatus Hakubella thermalkaliphila]GFP29853.1 hypothetical protein HKBW3S34_00773 [Candidatus Hakubella thermalkaliphila]GFP37376.1 hypothetical protein HKBW3S44_01056 [Candidatus Hakubella thermalkaliphila]
MIGNWLSIVAIVFVVLRGVLRGYIGSAKAGALILISSIFLIAAGRSTLVRLATLAIPIYFFMKEFGIGDFSGFWSLILALLPLFIT